MDPRPLIAPALVAATLMAAGCSGRDQGRAPGERPHLVIVAIDALRFDHTGLGGYPAPTTPRLDGLAAESLVFTATRAASSYTLQSVASLFTGRLPSSGGSVGLLEAQPSESSITLASAFRRAGYRTALATNQPLLKGRGFTRGFDDVSVSSAEEAWPCDRVVERGLAAFDLAPDLPRLLYLQLAEPHEPHTPADEMLRRFSTASPPAATAADSETGSRDLVARYDAEIATADACLGAVVDGLRQRGALDRSVLVVLGTQGEELGEHGDTGSGWTLYDEVLRVPLLIRAPGLLDPGTSGAPSSIVDLHPTLLALHAVPAAEETLLDGRSLLAERGGRFRPAQEGGRAVIAELVIPERAIVRAVVEDGAKYIAAVKAHPPADRAAVAAAYFDVVAAAAKGESEAQPLWAPPAIEELYDLAADPDERMDLAGDSAAKGEDRLQRLRDVLARYEQRCREHGLAARRAKPRAELPTAEEIENLKSLSYL